MRTMTAALASFVLLCPASAFADADAVHEALDAYALYQNDVSALLDADIDSGRAVDAALARISRHNSARVARGWIAYGALTAAQSPQFAAGVERGVRDSGRGSALTQLRNDVTFARRQQAGADHAIGLILSAAGADSARTAQAGARYDRWARSSATVQLVTSVQHTNLRESARLSSEMLARLHIGPLAGRPMSDADAFGGRGFWDSLAGREARAPGGRGGREQREYASVTDHMLTLGALVVADATGNESRRVSALLNEPLTQYCLQMEQLQLRQCVASAHDVSERAYCLGRHGLTGTGACFANMVR